MRPVAGWVADRVGVLLAVGGGIALLASLWLPWYSTPLYCIQVVGARCPRGVQVSAWDAFQVADAALAVLAVGAIAGALAGPAIAGRFAWLAVAAVGWVALALTLYAINRATAAPVPGRVTDAGYFVALLAGGGIVGGAWWEILRRR